MTAAGCSYGLLLRRYARRILRIFTHGELPGRVEARLYYLRYLVREKVLRWLVLRTKRRQERTPSVCIYLENAIQDRYLFQLISFFIYGGCSVAFITDKPKTLFANLEYARMVYTFKNFTILRDPIDTDEKILCTDSKNSPLLARNWKKIIVLNQNVSVDRKDHQGAMIMPYPMHPIIYKRRHHEMLREFRLNERRVAVLFSGNYGEGYTHSILPDQYRKMSRPEIMALLLASMVPQVVTRREEINALLGRRGYRNVFMLVNTQNIYRIASNKM